MVTLIYALVLQKLDLVNGVLFTGGWAKTGPYVKVVEGIFKVIAYLLKIKITTDILEITQ